MHRDDSDRPGLLRWDSGESTCLTGLINVVNLHLFMLPQLMMKVWDGDLGERFTYLDMRRIEFNANIVAREAGVQQVTFDDVTRASQFDYTEAERLETQIQSIIDVLGLGITVTDLWGPLRTLSYVDFERWESCLWSCYQILGGIGERIPADKILVVVSATLFADGWQGTGPYHQDLEVPVMNADRESVVYLHHSADLWQRVAEYNALLLAEPMEGVLRVNALSIKPDRNLPIRIQFGGFETMEIVTLKANAWEGPENGPWTQTVALSGPVRDGIIGAQSGMTAAQAQAFTEGAIHSAGVKGSDMTVRAMYRKPTIDLPVGIVWNADEVA